MSTIKSSAENLTLNADGANNDVIIQSNASTLVTVDGATGNVGVGTTSPANTLHVQKDVDDFVCKIENDGNSTSSDGLWIDTRWNASNNTMLKVTTNSGGTEVIRVTPAGITFNGDTAAANALDDYEEGTWTPTYSNMGTHAGAYVKIGSLVTCTGYITTSGGVSGTAFSGLPFPSIPVAGYRGSGVAGYQNVTSSTVWSILVGHGTSTFTFRLGSTTPQMSNSKSLYFSLSYRTLS